MNREPDTKDYEPGHGPFAKGYDPRRSVGAPSIGRRITACWNELGREDEEGNAVYSMSDLRAIVDDEQSSHAKASAATIILSMREQGWDRIGRQPKALASVTHVLDRILGKPTQEIRVQVATRPHSEILDDLARHLPEILAAVTPSQIEAAIRQRPELAAVFRQAIDGGPVETTAALIEPTPEEVAEAMANDIVVRDIEGARRAEAGPRS